jgi:hypothetical protein
MSYSTKDKTALMMTAARVAFGMYAKVEVRRPSAIRTMTPETVINTLIKMM